MKTYDLFGEVVETPPKFFQSPMPSDVMGGRTTKGKHRQNETGIRKQVLSNPSTYSSADSPVRISRWQARARASTEAGAVFGGSSTALSVKFDLDTSSWRTSLRSLFGGFLPFLERFPRSGMMRNGRLYRRPRLVPRTLEIDSSLWPTPNTTPERPFRGNPVAPGPSLMEAVKMWPTPQAFDATDLQRSQEALDRAKTRGGCRNLREEVKTDGSTGQLNPRWVEWLMGFPDGWTDLEP